MTMSLLIKLCVFEILFKIFEYKLLYGIIIVYYKLAKLITVSDNNYLFTGNN